MGEQVFICLNGLTFEVINNNNNKKNNKSFFTLLSITMKCINLWIKILKDYIYTKLPSI